MDDPLCLAVSTISANAHLSKRAACAAFAVTCENALLQALPVSSPAQTAPLSRAQAPRASRAPT
eukprot:2158586-Pleurochrysis_carterae.AAC.3